MNPERTMPPTPESNYHSYLLRLWQVPGGGGGQWRASLEDVQTGDRQGFNDLASLVGFLDSLTHSHQVRKVILEPPTEDNRLD
jgi:hypothetical protein